MVIEALAPEPGNFGPICGEVGKKESRCRKFIRFLLPYASMVVQNRLSSVQGAYLSVIFTSTNNIILIQFRFFLGGGTAPRIIPPSGFTRKLACINGTRFAKPTSKLPLIDKCCLACKHKQTLLVIFRP